MVVSILCLATSLILTFGKSASRFFDRLNISFSFSLILQFVLLAIAILPHVKVDSGSGNIVLNLIAYLLMSSCALIYFVYNRTKMRYANLIVVIVLSTIFLLATLIVVSNIVYDDYFVSIMMMLISFAVVFAFSTTSKTAFLAIFIAFVLLLICSIFTPINSFIAVDNLPKIIIDSLIPSLFITMFSFNLFRRDRDVGRVC